MGLGIRVGLVMGDGEKRVLQDDTTAERIRSVMDVSRRSVRVDRL